VKAPDANRAGAIKARVDAVQVITAVLEGRYLDGVLDELRGGRRDDGTLALVQELVYGTLRWYQRLSGVAALFLARPLKAKDHDLHTLLLTGLYQLRHMRVADHAAVDLTVAAAEALNKRWAKGLINACLRSAMREAERVDATINKYDELRYSHPAWLIDAIKREHPDAWQRVLEANNERPPMTLRVNLRRTARLEYLERLQAQGLTARVHGTVESALMLDTPVPVEQLPGFAEGDVSVQDAAGQLAAVLLDAQPGERVLDACAAPGGKTAHILERTAGIEVWAVEIEPSRLERLRHGLARLGLTAHALLGDASEPSAWWDGRGFDRILVDAPCSATGVIRRHPDIKVRRRPEEIAKLRQTQARLLDGVWPCLKPGGKLWYATCSVLRAENREQLREFKDRHADATLCAAEDGGMERQILPGTEEMDGFYYACLRKT
jgi:16S rRNA (cytosine967-C5)-methyltransferase